MMRVLFLIGYFGIFIGSCQQNTVKTAVTSTLGQTGQTYLIPEAGIKVQLPE
jgi:hypothetical protein